MGHGQAGSEAIVTLARAAERLKAEPLPDEVKMRARQRILDTLGCLVAGYDAGISEQVRDYVRQQGGRPEATLLPGGEKTTVALVCLAHATYIHGLELSDAAPRGTVHPGNEVVPPAIALCEREGCNGRQLIAAVVAGYEVEIRVGRALYPSAFYRGWWTPGLLGPLGAAVTAGLLLGLDAKGLENAIGIAINLLPSAMGRATEEGGGIKWLIGGQACSVGVLAAEMAARNVEGMRDMENGWFPIITDEFDLALVTDGINEDGAISQWEIASGIVTKHYATVGPLTSPLDATFDILKANDISPEDVEEVQVDCMRRTAIFNVVHPENDAAARASLPYCLAVAICTGDPSQLLGPGFAREMLDSPVLRSMASKVKIIEKPEYEALYPAKSIARVKIRLSDGSVYSEEVDRSARGRYLTPTDQDIADKVRHMTAPIIGEQKTERLIEITHNIEDLTDFDELVGTLTVGN